MVLNKTRNRLKFLSIILLIGTSLVSLSWILFPFFCPFGYAFLIWIPLLLVLSIFIVVSILTLKNLNEIKHPDGIHAAFIVVLVGMGFQGLWFNESRLEWLGLLLILAVIITGIIVRNPLVKLEIMNWTGLIFLMILVWHFLTWS